jgi:hypothetical protein
MLALVERVPELAARLAALGRLLAARVPPEGPPRIWIEGLPAALPGALRLLEDLAR